MAQAAYTREVLLDSPRAFYKLDEPSGLPQDSSGNGFHMTTATGIDYQFAQPFSDAWGVRLNTNSDSISRAVFSTAVDNITLEAWVMSLQATNLSSFVINGSASVGYAMSQQSISAHNYLCTVNVTQQTNFVNAFKSWICWTLVRRSTVWEYYLNGSLYNSNAGTTTPTTPAAAFSIGDSNTNCIRIVSNVSLYETALSSGRIAAHFAAAMEPTRTPSVNRVGRGAGW